MMVFGLSRCGYGSVAEITAMPAKRFFDLVEYETMRGRIEGYEIEQARKNGGK